MSQRTVEALAAKVESLSIESLLTGAMMLADQNNFEMAKTFATVAIRKLDLAMLNEAARRRNP